MTQSLNSPVLPLPLALGWTNYGGGYTTAGYWKDPNGLVHLRGLATYAAAWSYNWQVAILPVGFRPLAGEMFNQQAYDGTTGGLGARVDVYATGILEVKSSIPAASGASIGWLSLAGIQFLAGV